MCGLKTCHPIEPRVGKPKSSRVVRDVLIAGSVLYLMFREGHPKNLQLPKKLRERLEPRRVCVLHNPDDLIKTEDPEDGVPRTP